MRIPGHGASELVAHGLDTAEASMSRKQLGSLTERRRFLKLTGAAGAGLALGGGSFALLRTRRAEGQPVGGGLKHFVDPLPVPDTISPIGTLNDDPLYRVTMQAFTKKLHRDLPATPLWGYNGQYPGRSEEHTSELQSLRHLVCRLLL